MTSTDRPTNPFRDEHAELRRHMDHVRHWIFRLVRSNTFERRRTMVRIVAFFDDHVRPHAAWEEEHLYPVADRLAGGREPFTATMRHEHRVADRWLEQLRREADAPTPDVRAFVRRADNLMGLLLAHFECEEEVLLPLIDHTMSEEQYRAEVGVHAARAASALHVG